MRRAVRLERGESLRRPFMALLAGFQAVGRIDRRSWIVHALDAMVAVAVETLGRIRVTQLVDLAVIGFGVGFQALLMAVAAVLGDRESGRILRRVFDVMGGVAIGADGRDRVLVLQHFFSVHRGRVLRAFVGMTLAADIRNVQAPLLAFRTAGGINIVGIVAVVAGCIGAR